jgi:hypothetical protein
VDEFKVALKKKANGKIKEEKPSVVALGSDKGGGKFNVTILSLRMSIFQGFLDLARHSFKVLKIHKFACFKFSSKTISNSYQHNPRGKLLSHFHF